MIGTYEDAALALADFTARNDRYMLSDDGCSRKVYLINGVVYKVARFLYLETNEFEWDRYLSMDNLPGGVALPEMNMFYINDETPVIAAEYIDGMPTGVCLSCHQGYRCEEPDICMSYEKWEDIHNSTGLMDNCIGNLIYRDGIVYLIDIAS